MGSRPTLDPAAAEARLRQYIDPVFDTDLYSAGCVSGVSADGEGLRIALQLPFPARRYGAELERALSAALECPLTLDLGWQVESHAVQGQLQALPGIRNTIAVASGKGGVGKSTVAANLALALAAEGASVGVLDADIYGPSQVRMLGATGRKPELIGENAMKPVETLGLRMMSIGLLVDEEEPTIWRGPMVTQALQQLLGGTQWGELDYLIIDLPPGTGDTQLSLAQRIPVSGAVIVTTPQDIALLDARKGLRMFEKVGVDVLGVVENMSLHSCSSCGHTEAVFGDGGGARLAEQYGVRLLGQLPLAGKIREQADAGAPTVVAEPDSPTAALYFDIARRVAAQLALTEAPDFPEIIVEDDR